MASHVDSMYPLKPVFNTDSEFNFSSSMYTMKNLLAPQAKNKDTHCEMYEDIDRRQQIILKHISDIKEKLNTLRKILETKLNKTQKIVQSGNLQSAIDSVAYKLPQEIVVNASIDHPPYSVLLLPLLLRGIPIQLSSHSHSSLDSLPDVAQQFSSLQSTASSSCSIRLRLIWKKGETESVVCQTPFSGEVPLLRLVNTFTQNQRTLVEDIQLLEKLDEFQLKGVEAISKPASKFLFGNSISVLDAAVWSLIKNSPAPPNSLKNWFTQFNDYVKVSAF